MAAQDQKREWIIRHGCVHGSCLPEPCVLPGPIGRRAWYPIDEEWFSRMPAEMFEDLLATAWPIPPKPVEVQLSWGDLQKLNRGEDIQTKVKGIGDVVVRV